MKLIVEKETTICKYVFANEVILDVRDDRIITPEFIIGDLNSLNTLIYENINDVPADYAGCKYFYNGSWSLNPKWSDPSDPQPPPPPKL